MARNILSISALTVSVACCFALSIFSIHSIYSKYTIAVVIPYYSDAVNAVVPFTNALHVRVKLQNGIATTKLRPTIDTGSCGYVMSVNSFPGWSQSLADANELGWEFLSSSKLLYSGHWIPVDIYFPDAPVETKARVPVLVVEDVTTCPQYNEKVDKNVCPPVDGKTPDVIHHPKGISLMGIGFARNKDGQSQGTPDKNAFLNVLSIDGVGIPNNGLFRNGYIIDKTGITIGLTGPNTHDITHWQSLNRGTSWNTDHRDWAAVQASLSVDENCFAEGTLLIDTGINDSYLTLPTGTIIHSHLKTSPNSHQKVRVLNNGSVVHLRVGGEFGLAVDEGIVVGDPEGIASGVVPEVVIVSLRDESMDMPFLNTGRHFLRGWKVAFDAVGGRFGFQKVTSTEAQISDARRSPRHN